MTSRWGLDGVKIKEVTCDRVTDTNPSGSYTEHKVVVEFTLTNEADAKTFYEAIWKMLRDGHVEFDYESGKEVKLS